MVEQASAEGRGRGVFRPLAPSWPATATHSSSRAAAQSAVRGSVHEEAVRGDLHDRRNKWTIDAHSSFGEARGGRR